MKSTKEFLPIGEIVGPHGIQGILKVHSFAESTSVFKPKRHLLLQTKIGENQPVTVAWAKPFKRNLILMALEGVEDRNQSEALAGSRLLMRRDALPSLEEDTFYWDDLIGLEVYEADGRHLGAVKQILATGSNDVYVVEKSGVEVLVPALKSVILEVDLDRGMLRVALPEGL